MLLVYNYVLLKMRTWYAKHVEDSNNIWWINNIQWITLVVLYGQTCRYCFPRCDTVWSGSSLMTQRSNILPQSYNQKMTAVVTLKRPLAWIAPQCHIIQSPPGKKNNRSSLDRRTLLMHRVPLNAHQEMSLNKSCTT